MLRDAYHSKVEAFVTPLVKSLHAKGFTPNQLTLAGLALTFVSGWIYSSGLIFLGGFVMLLAALGDMLDGPLARLTGQTSRFGAFLDSTVDRYSDLFIFGGLVLYFADQGETGRVFMLLGIIAGSFVTSYAKARSENLIEKCNVGIFERADRIVVLGLGSLIPPLLPLALWVLLIGTNFTAVQRILFTRKALTEKPQ